MMGSGEKIQGIHVVTAHTRTLLSGRQLTDYANYKSRLLRWLLNFGKDPEKAEGCAKGTVRQVSYKTDQFFRWKWDQNDGYTTRFTTEDAEAFIENLIYNDEEYSSTHKSCVQKCLIRLIHWRRVDAGEDIEWDPIHTFSASATQACDSLTIEERSAIREAALEYGSIPSYSH